MYFYGTYHSGGNDIYTNYANSNNYDIAVDGTNVTITFKQWTYYKPTVTVSPAVSSDDPAMACNCWIGSRGSISNPWIATIKSYVLRDGVQTAAKKNFSFHVRSGMTRLFDAEDLTLTPEIIDFQGAKVLALSTTIDTKKVYLDKGTVLIGVGTRMALRLGQTSICDHEGTWALTGWTYGGGSGPNGQQWSTAGGESTPSFELTTDPSQSGPATTPYTFAIKGVRKAGSGQQYISSDPVVRLSSVPPGGISL